MSNQILKDKTRHFLDVVDKNSIVDPSSNNPIFENGLVVFEGDSSKISAKDVFSLLPSGKGLFITLDNSFDYNEFIRNFSIANREGQWLVVDLQCDPHPDIIGIMKQVAEDNEATISGYKNKDLYPIKLNPKTRIVVCVNRNLAETVITYPFFYNLFGPNLSL